MAGNLEDMKKLAFELGYKYEGTYGACSQATMRALQEVYAERNNDIFKGMTGFAGGCGIEGDGICGAYAAGIFFISLKVGRVLDDLDKDPEDPSAEKILFKNFGLVKDLHEKFIEKYPTLQSLADSKLVDVLELWSGLGYNRRAKWLRECAISISEKPNFPRSVEELRELKGIGPYSSRSILIFAFNDDFAAVDTNIKQIFLLE